ncbi:antitoxin CptB [Wenzhouxiangella marina]|uniref:FAD assembly factor SdhE n=2 Tax=Wenzhouxiangella marina TaxID=1579979 RepID=A0A0K0XX18_9GAMM|nr:hypothetical protein WM2015_1809 [Wenzhouxiangella marina]MBB6086052.1 antitoxin CptB [Wenzhouxiangella marina]
MRELDVLLSRWLEDCWGLAPPPLQSAFEDLLGCEDDQIWDWLMGRALPPEHLSTLIEAIGQHHARASSER